MSRVARPIAHTAARLTSLVLSLSVVACTRAPLVSDGRYAMGTVLEITLGAARDDVAERQIDALYDAVEALEARVSNWRRRVMSAARRRGRRQPLDVDPAVFALLARCVEWTRLTRGTFDVDRGAARRPLA